MVLQTLQKYDQTHRPEEEILQGEILDANAAAVVEKALAKTDSDYFVSALELTGFRRKANAVAEAGKILKVRKEESGSRTVVSLRAIEEVAITYRLRFLSTHYYTGNIPANAVRQISQFVEEYKESHDGKTPNQGNFYILAPASMFELRDKPQVDPLVVYQITENSYVTVAQWGTDLSWWRSVLMFPLRNLFTFSMVALLLATVAVLATCYISCYIAWVAVSLVLASFITAIAFHANDAWSYQTWDSKLK